MNLFHEDLAIPAKNAAPINEGLEHAPLHGPAVERRVLGFGTKAVDFNTAGSVEVEQHQVGWDSLGEPTGGEPEDFCRALTQRTQSLEQRQMAVVHELEREWQQSLQADDAGLGGGEGQALRILRMRRVIAGDGIDGAVLEARHHCAPVALAPEWRRELGGSAVLADR